ncbi:MAG: histone deacetylase family protein [Planctomycetota bacterium]|nr:histone deacetylase family protein [Planctomycetota bacterium]
MFSIRRIYDDILPVNQTAIADVRRIFIEHFPDANRDDITQLAEKLRNPFKQRFRGVLYVAEKRGQLIGFAIVLHEPVLKYCFLDYIATGKLVIGRGIGAALYEHIRDEALRIGANGLFFECLPDEPERCADPAIRKLNASRLKFYETYGARPIVGTAYESPLPGSDGDNMPFLVYDDLDRNEPLSSAYDREVVRGVLERKYSELCPPEYVQNVVASFKTNPVRIRDFRYVKDDAGHRPATPALRESIAVVINDKHEIHHIRERGYVEAPVRINAIMKSLEPSGLIETLPAKEYSLDHILAVHDGEFVKYLKKACENTPSGKSVYPYVFPIRNTARPPKELSIRAGYYCIDTFTPINEHAFPAAKRAVDCALTAADAVLSGRRIAYALVRPPGHHAEYKSFGGFCYFNNAAVAAQHLCRFGKVVIVDVDYHHGNGQQDIFYRRSDVLTLSIHGDPDFAYPYFSGFADEQGEDAGEGFNINLPLPESINGEQYRKTLMKALDAVKKFDPGFLVIALGLDPAKGDPTGTWSLTPKDFEQNGHMLGELRLPTLVVQEGGYRTRTLGTNALHFFRGLSAAVHEV